MEVAEIHSFVGGGAISTWPLTAEHVHINTVS